MKGGAFKRSQSDFLLTLFNNNGGPKIRERDVVLSESQIKSWFSSEVGHRKKEEVNRVIEKGFTELSQSIDLQDNQEGGHDQNGGDVEEGDPPPPPPPPSPPSLL